MSDNEKKLIDPIIPTEEVDDFGPERINGLIRPLDVSPKTKGIEDKVYIILYVKDIEPEEDEMYQWCYSVRIGRTETYADIKEKLTSGLNIDIHKSKVITETKQIDAKTGDKKYFLIPLDEASSIYNFCITVADYFSDDTFNIEDYNNTEIPEDPNTLTSNLPNYLTPEQQEYQKMLNESLGRQRLFEELRAGNISGSNI